MSCWIHVSSDLNIFFLSNMKIKMVVLVCAWGILQANHLTLVSCDQSSCCVLIWTPLSTSYLLSPPSACIHSLFSCTGVSFLPYLALLIPFFFSCPRGSTLLIINWDLLMSQTLGIIYLARKTCSMFIRFCFVACFILLVDSIQVGFYFWY